MDDVAPAHGQLDYPILVSADTSYVAENVYLKVVRPLLESK